MVRFSEFLGIKDKRRHRVPPSEKGFQIQKLRMSDLQVMGMDDISEDTTQDTQEQEPSDVFLADRHTEKVREYFNELVKKAKDIRSKVKKNQEITHSPVLSILHNIIDEDLIDQLYEYALLVPYHKGLPLHSVSVILACLKVGRGMGYNIEKLLKLGLAAFLENVGMYQVPDRILEKRGELSTEEMATVRKHPENSARILGRMPQAFQWLAEVTLQVHERWDGSGYPKGLKGEQISEFASIIGLVDTYMAMIRNRPHRTKYVQTEAVKDIIELGQGKFAPRVFKEFLDQISLFPVNTCVKLNNNSIGRVLSTDKAQPLRPTIEILYDGLGQKTEKRKIIRLSKTPLLHIVEAIDEKELAK